MSSVGAALSARALEFIRSGVPPLKGLNKCIDYFTQGLRPGLCRSIALTGLLYVFSINILYYFDAVALPKGQLLALLQGLNDGG